MTIPDYSVVYLSSIDWSFRRQDHQFICLELAARGHEVVYVENLGARLPGLRDVGRLLDRVRNFAGRMRADDRATIPDHISVVSPLAIPGAASSLERWVNLLLVRTQLARSLGRLRRRPVILWVGLPTWTAVDLVEALSPALTVYYCGDAFAEIPGVRPSVRASEAALVPRADVVIANSRALAERCRRLGAEPLLVPVGIDLSASQRARAGDLPLPTELSGLAGRLIGYMGGLNHKVDVSILEAVSVAFPNDTLVCLGSIEDPQYRPNGRNIVILGDRPYENIGAYLMRFAVCLIPYLVNAFTVSVYPGKLVEYLAHGRPVVSTPLPEVLAFSPVVRIAGDRDGFVRAVAEALNEPDTPSRREERLRWVLPNSYDRIGVAMVQAVEDRLSR